MDIKKSEKTETPLHTLLTREIRPDRNWHELMERWQAAVTQGDMLGVLHRGFDVSLEKDCYDEKEYGETDRLIFYFTIADGWEDHSLLRLPTDGDNIYAIGRDSNGNVIRRSPSELRQQLARKAFDMLCLNFFKKAEIPEGFRCSEFGYIWESMITAEPLFLVIQNFFRAEKGRFRGVRMRNLSRRDDKRSHNEEYAVKFLVNLAKFIWGWKEEEIMTWSSNKEETKKRNVKMRSRLDASKFWMIEVLTWLDRLDVLRILELDKLCLTRLREIAMRSEFSAYAGPVREDRPVATLDEACYLGSKAAWFLKEHEIMTREHRRLTEISEAKKQKAEADRKIKKLTANE